MWMAPVVPLAQLSLALPASVLRPSHPAVSLSLPASVTAEVVVIQVLLHSRNCLSWSDRKHMVVVDSFLSLLCKASAVAKRVQGKCMVALQVHRPKELLSLAAIPKRCHWLPSSLIMPLVVIPDYAIGCHP